MESAILAETYPRYQCYCATTMIHIKNVMQVYTVLYHAFMPSLYAVLYTRVYTRFMPRVHRLALYQADLQVVRICNIYRHLQNHQNITRLFIKLCILHK